MAKLTQKQCRNRVYRYFLLHGWLPAGTTEQGWEPITLAELELDDPPLPADPHLQKKRIALDLQDIFFFAEAELDSPLSQLKDRSLTLGELAIWCFQNHR